MQAMGFRWIEAFIIALLGVIAACFIVQIAMADPDWGQVIHGFAPTTDIVTNPDMLYLALGIMIPIRLATVAILQLMVASGLVNTLTALVLVYTAQGLPLAIFILSEFMKGVSDDLKNAGRIDGLSEYTIFFRLVLPLVRPAMATVAVFTMIPIWNDLWFPLILAPSEATKTVTLGAQLFLGQYVTNWNAVLAALSLAILPVLILYIAFSRQLIRGITSGAVK